MVYSERKNRGEAKCAVYGLSTDCERFAFYHVDDYGDVGLFSLLSTAKISNST